MILFEYCNCIKDTEEAKIFHLEILGGDNLQKNFPLEKNPNNFPLTTTQLTLPLKTYVTK